MFRGNQEGPNKRERITYDIVECGMCKYHQSVMRKSGRNPIHEHYCQHPEMKWDRPGLAGIEGYYIGQSDIVPDECPYLKDENRESA